MTSPGFTDPSALTDGALRTHIAAELSRARTRSSALTDAVDEPDLISQHSPLMSPLVWDFAHIGNQEEIWLVRDVGGREAVRSDIDENVRRVQESARATGRRCRCCLRRRPAAMWPAFATRCWTCWSERR